MKNYEGGFSESFAARNQQQSVESNHKHDGDNKSVKFYAAPQTQKSESDFSAAKRRKPRKMSAIANVKQARVV